MELGAHNAILSHDDANGQDKVRGKTVTYLRNERMAGSVVAYNTDTDTRFQEIVHAYGSVDESAPENIKVEELSTAGTQEDEFSFWDFLDIVNPLQHIPIVNYIYREITGDEIKPIGKIVGGGIYGGPVGAASGLVNAMVEDSTGKDLVGNAMRAVRPEQEISKERIAYDDLPVTLLSMAQTPAQVSSAPTKPKIFFNA